MPESHLITLARRGNARFPGLPAPIYSLLAVLYAMLAPLAISIAVAIPYAIFLVIFSAGQPVQDALPVSSEGMAVLLVASFLPLFLVVWLWLWLVDRRPLWTVGLERQGWLKRYLRGLLVGVLLMGLTVAVPGVLGYMEVEGAALGFGAALLGIGALWLGWMVQGAAEEVLFRGFLLQVIGVRHGTLAGILVSSALFGLLHIFNQGLSVLAMLNLGLFGVFAALYALREGGLWGVFALHSAWNWAQANLFGMEVSGLPARFDALVKLRLTGPEWLTGGAFGPEGGIVVTGVLVIGILFVTFLQRKPPGSTG
jgi:hypothetical protein